MIKSILSEGKHVLVANLFERFISIIIFWLIARLLGAEIYGQIVTVFAFSGIADVFFQFGFPIYIQRESAKNNPSIYNSINQMFSIRIWFSFLYLPVCVFYFVLFHPETSLLLVFTVSFAVFIQSINQIYNSYFFGTLNSKVVLISIIISRTLLIISALVFLGFRFNYHLTLISFFGSYILQLIILMKHYRQKTNFLRSLKFSPQKDFKLISSCFPLALVIIFSMSYDRIDSILIASLMNFKSTGFYNAAYSLYKLPLLPLSVLLVPAFSFVAKLKDKEKTLSVFFKLILGVSMYATLFAIFLFCFSKDIIGFIYGNNFNSSVLVLNVLSFGLFFVILNNLTGMMINGLELNKKNTLILLLGLIINIFCNLLLIKKIGVAGAAWATVLSEAFILFAQFGLVLNYLRKK